MSMHLLQATINRGLQKALNVQNPVFMKKEGGDLATVLQKTVIGEQIVFLALVRTLKLLQIPV